jgi:uncharacterized protein (DUF952 family)/mannose-6-phosphate isomerase-like protein (cupin superfamily)
MPKLIGKAIRVVEVDGLAIDEYVGNVASNSDDMSIAFGTISKPTSEPWLTLDYDEWFLVTKGRVDIKYGVAEVLTAKAGETIFIAKGERFRPVFPDVGAEYVAVCNPAFKPERCHREEDSSIDTSDVSAKLADLHSKEKTLEDTNPSSAKFVYHMCQKTLWDKAIHSGKAYFPPTFAQDGFFTHSTAVPVRLIETANQFYTATKGDWICVELSTEKLLDIGIMTVFEEPKPVGEKAVRENWKSSQWHCPHIYGGIPASIQGVVMKTYDMKRDSDGNFLSVVDLTDTAE